MKPSRSHVAAFVAGAIGISAMIGGAVVGKNLLESGAATRPTLAVSQSFGQKQAAVHLQGSATAPFLGPYKLGQCGPGVRLMEGALANLPKPVRRAKAANCFGKATRAQVITFQKRLHYKPTGQYNLATHQQLVKRGGYSKTAKAGLVYLYDQRLIQAHKLQVSYERASVRNIAIHAQKVGGTTLRYTQHYPARQILPAWPALPPSTDCSGFSTWILYQAGAGAAVGYYGPGSPVGWTGTLKSQGYRVAYAPRSFTGLQPGDLVFYGRAPNWSHVATYIGGGLVVSHGQTGVYIESYRYRRDIGEVRRYIS